MIARRVVLLALLAMTALLLPGAARAQGQPDLRAWVDTDTIELGQTLQFSMQATSDVATPHDPQLGAPPGVAVRKTGEMPTHMSFNFNGVKSERHTLMVNWQVRPSKVGTFHVGPATIAIGAARYSTKSVKVTVLPAGSAPHLPRTAPPPSPVDPFKGLFGQDFDDDPFKTLEPRLEPDPKLALPAPLGTVAFLRAFVDKSSVVVGEQVTFTVHLYIDASEREPDFHDVHEAPAADFARKSLQDNDTQAAHVGIAMVAGRPYAVKLLRRSALFPLRAGDLVIGPMTVSVAKTRAANGARASETIRVRVAEPPVAGRPPGYVTGTVGKLQLAAQVSPRETPAGGALAVDVELSGTGNLPASLPVPIADGVEWLEPQIQDKLGRDGERFGGKRSFSYVVKVFREGMLDLGEVALPFYDPEAGAYQVARAALGSVRVTPGQGAHAKSPAEPSLLPDLPAARPGLEGERPARIWLTDARAYWFSLGAAPFGWAIAVAWRSSARRIRTRLAERAASPVTELKQRVAAAERACTDVGAAGARAATAAIARALEAAAVARLGVNVRGVSDAELVGALRDAGAGDEDARALRDLLRECDDVRFSPEEGDASAVADRWKRARAAMDAMPRGGA